MKEIGWILRLSQQIQGSSPSGYYLLPLRAREGHPLARSNLTRIWSCFLAVKLVTSYLLTAGDCPISDSIGESSTLSAYWLIIHGFFVVFPLKYTTGVTTSLTLGWCENEANYACRHMEPAPYSRGSDWISYLHNTCCESSTSLTLIKYKEVPYWETLSLNSIWNWHRQERSSIQVEWNLGAFVLRCQRTMGVNIN